MDFLDNAQNLLHNKITEFDLKQPDDYGRIDVEDLDQTQSRLIQDLKYSSMLSSNNMDDDNNHLPYVMQSKTDNSGFDFLSSKLQHTMISSIPEQ
jgi:hypothetical protein